MAHEYTLNIHLSSGTVYLLEWDEQNDIVAAIPNTEMSIEELAQVADDIAEPGQPKLPTTLDQEWHNNAEWAMWQEFGPALTPADFSLAE